MGGTCSEARNPGPDVVTFYVWDSDTRLSKDRGTLFFYFDKVIPYHSYPRIYPLCWVWTPSLRKSRIYYEYSIGFFSFLLTLSLPIKSVLRLTENSNPRSVCVNSHFYFFFLTKVWMSWLFNWYVYILSDSVNELR